jgi:phosphoribosylformylglycinamidine synthase
VLDLARERALQRLVVRLIGQGLVQSAHDCAEGGLAVTVAESTFDTGGIGVTASVPAAGEAGPFQALATLFGESSSRIVISVAPEHVQAVLAEAGASGVPASTIGETGGDRIRLSVGATVAVDVAVAEAESAWLEAIERRMTRRGGR